MEKNLFIFAHYDDEVFSIGTIAKMLDNNQEVNILIICGNGYSLEDERKYIFDKHAKELGIKTYSLKYFDLTLNDLKFDVTREIKSSISRLIYDLGITKVYTNSSNDLHDDHKIVSTWVRTVCRPLNTKIKALYECYISGANEYGTNDSTFNTIVDISNYQDMKYDYMKDYKDYLKNGSSKEVSNTHSRYIGSLYGMDYAEIFKLIWKRE